jgi:hypothetical protein
MRGFANPLKSGFSSQPKVIHLWLLGIGSKLKISSFAPTLLTMK